MTEHEKMLAEQKKAARLFEELPEYKKALFLYQMKMMHESMLLFLTINSNQKEEKSA